MAANEGGQEYLRRDCDQGHREEGWQGKGDHTVTHVFVDESYRTSYLLVATHLSAGLDAVRAELRGLCGPGQRRIHFQKESDRRRKRIISMLLTTTASAKIYQIDGPQERARADGLTELVTRLPDSPRSVLNS